MVSKDQFNIKPKTPEQLKEQQRLVQAERKLVGWSDKPVTQLDEEWFSLSPEEFKKRLSEDPEFQKEYQECLKSWRRIRKETAEYYQKHPPQEKKSLYELPHTPLLEKILKRVQGNMEYGSGKLFRDEELDEAKQSIDKFYLLLRNIIKERPDVLVGMAHELCSLFDQKEIKAMIYSAVEIDPSSIFHRIEKLENFFSSQELESLLLKASETCSYERLSQDVRKKLAAIAISERITKNINKYIKQGLVTADQARDSYLKFSRDNKYGVPDREAFEPYSKLFEDRKHQDQLKEAINQSIENDKFTFLFNFDLYENILGEKWKKEVIEQVVRKEPNMIFYYFELMRPVLGDARTTELVMQDLGNYVMPDRYEMLRESGLFSDGQLLEMRQTIINKWPSYAFSRLPELLADYPEKERSGVIRNLFERSPRSLTYNSEAIEQITDMDEHERDEFARELVLNSNDFDFLRKYQEEGKDAIFLQKIIPLGVLEDFLIKKAEINPLGIFYSLKEVRAILDSDKKLEEFVRRFAPKIPIETLSNFEMIAYLFPGQEKVNFLKEILVRDEAEAIFSIDKWAKFIPLDEVREMLTRLIKKKPGPALDNIDSLMPYFPEEERKPKIESLINENPPIAVYALKKINKFIPDINQQDIIRRALQDERMAFAPKLLKDHLKRIEKAKDEAQSEAAIKNAYLLYEQISTIKQQEYESGYLTLFVDENLTADGEKALLESAYSYALINQQQTKEGKAKLSFPSTKEELERTTGHLVPEFLGIELKDPEQQQRAMEAFGGASPLLLYALCYQEDPQIMDLLRQIYLEAGRGTYYQWRFELDRPLEELQKEGKLPRKLTEEQRKIWAEDEETDITTALETTSTDIANEVRTVILRDANHFNSEVLQQKKDAQEMLQEIKEEIRRVGQETAELGKSLKGVNKGREITMREQIAELKEYREQLVREQYLLRLTMLSPKEVAEGYFLEGAAFKRGQKIQKALQLLREQYRSADTEPTFQQVGQALSEVMGESQKAERIVAEDSSNLKVSFRLGADPVGSCQHYATGSMNEALLGYVAEANTKVFIVRNEKGNIVARRVCRLLEIGDGEPVLFIEEKYAATASGVVDQVLLTHALKKAKKLGARVFIKDVSVLPAGYEAESSREVVRSRGGRAPKVYVDAEGGIRQKGKYLIGGAKEIVKAA